MQNYACTSNILWVSTLKFFEKLILLKVVIYTIIDASVLITSRRPIKIFAIISYHL